MMTKRIIRLIMGIVLVLTLSLPAQAYIVTFYPDAHPESTSVDGYVAHFTGSIGTGISWSALRAASGNESDDDGTECINWGLAYFTSDTTGQDNLWTYLIRGIALFDTSFLPDDAIIESAVLSLYGAAKMDGLSVAPSTNIYSANPASNTDLESSDFVNVGTIAFCDEPITYAAWVTNGYNDFILNAEGLAAISKTGVTKIGIRNANYDAAGVAPAWKRNSSSGVEWYQADKGSGYEPKLVIEYSYSGEGGDENGDGEPIPEPASLLLLGFGVLGLALFRRKVVD